MKSRSELSKLYDFEIIQPDVVVYRSLGKEKISMEESEMLSDLVLEKLEESISQLKQKTDLKFLFSVKGPVYPFNVEIISKYMRVLDENDVRKVAIIVDSSVLLDLVLNLTRLTKSHVKMKTFNNEDDALRWLQE